MTIAAIYARKSKATDTGESILNQLERCRAYAHMKDWSVVEYSDEDYSGGDTNRPGFQRMLQDMEKGAFQNIIFYKLDRVSRKVLDICNFIEELNEKGIGFVSVKENFDTTTPIGRAMLLITAVFAQLERETIAERVKDNMYDLAKKGYWLGGKVPYGYVTNKTNNYGKKITELMHHPQESIQIKEIFQQYLNKNSSINQVKKYLDTEGIKNKRNEKFSLSQIKRILNNPIYIVADLDAYKFFKSMGCNIDSSQQDFNGAYGIIRYNHKGSNNSNENPPEEWIISVSKVHQGLITGKTYVDVQKTLNKRKNIPKRRSRRGLLTGLLYCGDCGGYMGIGDSPKILSTGEKSTYYRCMNKKNNRCDCHNSNIRTDVLDSRIVDFFDTIIKDTNLIQVSLGEIIKHSPTKAVELQNKRQKLQQELLVLEKNLSKLLEESILGNFPAHIIQEKTNEFQRKREFISEKLEDIDTEIHTYRLEGFNYEAFQEELLRHGLFQELPFPQQQKIIKSYIEKVIWNKGNLLLNFKQLEN